MPERYRRKPTEITAVQWDGSRDAATKIALLGADFAVPFLEERPALLMAGKDGISGPVNVHIGTWVATDGEGDFWPISEDTFERTYEPEDTPDDLEQARGIAKAQQVVIERLETERDWLRKLVRALDRILVAYRTGGRTPGRAIDEARQARERLTDMGVQLDA